ncbi:hypothetical protein RND71_031353 [Anisodus tanguticus]|uniref:Amino acid transporter transmembrane domain-containing protein n=1 Tax=Anisodus tanguticus TaxID=243964 RepID=A0AAE1RBN1_9SOLA|nr:hypothetical protein RND71_031353 [Anisodus tanguticus]
MAPEFQKSTMYVSNELESGAVQKNFDDDGREKRTGTLLTASAHIITAVIGSGVLSLAWAIAQLGWVVGPVVLLVFSFITYFTSTLLADCYRSPGPISGKRNYTYMDVVRSHLGGFKVTLCGIAQYANLVGVTIGYTITASISMVAVKRSNCFHKNGHETSCSIDSYPYMIIFAVIQIILSQIPNFHKLSWLSILAAVMSFTYASIGLGLSIAKAAGVGHHVKTSLTGVDITGTEKVWRSFQAIGDIAFAYAYSTVLIEIQASTFMIYLLVFCQPLYGFVEARANQRWPDSKFITSEHAVEVPCCGTYNFNLFRLVWRTAYVVVTAVIAMIFPFFNDFLGLIGAGSFYPLTVYFPIEMHIAQRKIPKYSFTWVWLKILSWTCLIVSLVAAAGSIQGLATDVKHYKPFSTQQ